MFKVKEITVEQRRLIHCRWRLARSSLARNKSSTDAIIAVHMVKPDFKFYFAKNTPKNNIVKIQMIFLETLLGFKIKTKMHLKCLHFKRLTVI